MQKCINPSDLNSNFKRISLGPQRTVIIESDKMDASSMSNNATLQAAGLKMKKDTKLNPRIIIHDIPVQLREEYIKKWIVQQNLQDVSEND